MQTHPEHYEASQAVQGLSFKTGGRSDSYPAIKRYPCEQQKLHFQSNSGRGPICQEEKTPRVGHGREERRTKSKGIHSSQETNQEEEYQHS